MRIEVRLIPDEGSDKAPESERKSIAVETHSRRGDAFNVEKSDAVLESKDATVFNVPPGGRLVITTPQAVNEVVYDRDQAAAVKTANQQNNVSRADKPTGLGQDTKPVAPPPPRPQMTAPPAQPTHQPSAHNPTEAAKAAQQSAPRPAGEKPPLPGSPVGSPPAGNEGKDNK